MNETPVREGEILAGKYRVEKVLGVGGMGVVVAATHLQLDERVALKFLVKDALNSADAVARFAREARAAVKIKSEHVARVIDVGTLETGAPYMVMEYLEGRDLSQVIQIQGPLPPEEAVEYILQACEAIAHAHVLASLHVSRTDDLDARRRRANRRLGPRNHLVRALVRPTPLRGRHHAAALRSHPERSDTIDPQHPTQCPT